MAKRILDEKFEKDIRGKVDAGLKDARGKVDRGLIDARVKADAAKAVLDLREEEVSGKIKEKPLEWVAGAFVAGLLIGKILSK